MVQLDGALAVAEELVSGLQHVLGHGAALAAGQGVGAAACVVADAQQICSSHLAVNGSVAGGGGEAVLVIESGGAAVLDQVSEGCQGGVVNDVGVHQLEDAVDLVQPFGNGHVGIVDGFQVAHKGLEEVVMGIDQTGIDEMTGSIQHLVVGQIQILADGNDSGAFNEHIAAQMNGILLVAGNNRFCVLNQDFLFHIHSPPCRLK